ncbi:DUF4233 domain-containing protein [Streptomyces alkaliphilus]|uniref:DUF4233 domain-containing protein n=1 Tax=Streptomyces alkaliphilus TaxID=1472722 RepID=A0A7W3Y0B0_9ACTN|nr:DUF4233 domain-containing protein [Streptomyces alkaliphilus]MBB0243429.1 DUF4233 domain-containing protein [Streptomyces alkaliphilus]MQS06379.1 DUF4233 domain-containing protein [Streptomyces alkaliphilus]
MRALCAATLIAEFIVLGLAGLVAMNLTDVPTGVLWAVCGTAMAVSLLLCGMLNRRAAVPVGWALQIGLIASGVVVPAMFLLGGLFAVLWWAAVHYGREIDAIKAARAAEG